MQTIAFRLTSILHQAFCTLKKKKIMSTQQLFIQLLVPLNYLIHAQTNTTTSPTPSPSYGCAYTVSDIELVLGAAVPLHTCLENPYDGNSYMYTCNTNKTEIIKHSYSTSVYCNPDESVIINTTIFVVI